MPPKHTPVKKTKAAGTSELETVSTAAGFTEEENAVMDKASAQFMAFFRMQSLEMDKARQENLTTTFLFHHISAKR